MKKAEGFPSYLAEAEKAGMDVNDWIESELGWLPARPILERTAFPEMAPDHTVVELGVGTGRWARHLVEQVPDGRLILVDHSSWIVSFLGGYFKDSEQVEVRHNDGVGLPFLENASVDIIFSEGTFIELKLGRFLTYFKEFSRILKPGGVCVIDFIDPETPDGWRFLETYSEDLGDCFTYHTLETVERVLKRAGLTLVGVDSIDKSTFIKARKEA